MKKISVYAYIYMTLHSYVCDRVLYCEAFFCIPIEEKSLAISICGYQVPFICAYNTALKGCLWIWICVDDTAFIREYILSYPALLPSFVSRFAKLSKHLRTKRALYTLKKSPMPFLLSHLNMYMFTWCLTCVCVCVCNIGLYCQALRRRAIQKSRMHLGETPYTPLKRALPICVWLNDAASICMNNRGWLQWHGCHGSGLL